MQIGNNYPNPLDNFVSYSYHFIMVASSTTESFRKMIAPEDDSPLWSRVNNVKLGEKFDLGSTDSAWLVLDTRRYSQYSITEYEAEHAFTGGEFNPTTPIALARMKIIDTTGLSFFNFIIDLFRNKTKSMRFSTFFLLNVLFVGHRDDGTSETISSSFIPLLMMQMGFEFSHIGSIYNVEFVELEGSVHQGNPASTLSDMGATLTVKSKPGDNTLGGLIQSLEDTLNQRSLNFYSSYANAALSTGNNKDGLGKLVQYMITLPNESGRDWSKFTVSTAAKEKYIEQQFLASKKIADEQAKDDKAEKATESPVKAKLNARNTPSGFQINFAQDTKIPDAVSQILQCCEELLTMGDDVARERGEAVLYKTIVSVTSDDTTYLVHIDVYPYYAPKLDKEGKILAGGPKGAKVIGDKSLVKNVITYDYIFTGANSHILDLKIIYSPEASQIALDTNLEIGAARFNANSSNPMNTRGIESMTKPSTNRKANDVNTLPRSSDPIFPTVKSASQLRASENMWTPDRSISQAVEISRKREEHRKTMATMHYLSSLELTMQIRGNPSLFEKYNDKRSRGGIAPHSSNPILSKDQRNQLAFQNSRIGATQLKSLISPALSSARDQYIKQYYQPRLESTFQRKDVNDPLKDGPDVATLPVFVKLNILAPNVGIDGEPLEGEKYTSFFYDGVYQILTIKHMFIDGTFTQELLLLPYNIDGSFDNLGEPPVAATATAATTGAVRFNGNPNNSIGGEPVSGP